MKYKITKYLENLNYNNKIYFFKTKEGRPLYIGRTSQEINKRINKHKSDNNILHNKPFVDEYFYIEYIDGLNFVESFILEIYLISKLKPSYNKEFMFINPPRFEINIEEISEIKTLNIYDIKN